MSTRSTTTITTTNKRKRPNPNGAYIVDATCDACGHVDIGLAFSGWSGLKCVECGEWGDRLPYVKDTLTLDVYRATANAYMRAAHSQTQWLRLCQKAGETFGRQLAIETLFSKVVRHGSDHATWEVDAKYNNDHRKAPNYMDVVTRFILENGVQYLDHYGPQK